tara:strand:+ start:5572 stop:6681 length:1110 start_codon:yes stop_codon:yes gene_type:complete
MKKFLCTCGQEIFFENNFCGACGRSLGFNFKSLDLEVIESETESEAKTVDGRIFKKCGNSIEYDACNWLIEKNENANYLCYACSFNRTIPNQSQSQGNKSINHFRWLKLENAKKRLIYTLARLGLAMTNGWLDHTSGVRFDFLENIDHGKTQNCNPVTTGYSDGVITINALEADDVALVTARSELNERQRTILGHFRHESGHYFWDKFFSQLSLGQYFDEIFGICEPDYRESLDYYYKNGPPRNWHDGYISAYATAHPSEDWAETWSHYLLIHECLDSAQTLGMIEQLPQGLNMGEALKVWRPLAVMLNQMNRSIGLQDAYPFVITRRIEQKLQYVDSLVKALKLKNQRGDKEASETSLSLNERSSTPT